MDIFRVLSRGASLKKSKDINADYTMPTKAQQVSQSKKQVSLSHQVEKELDFFHHKSHKTVEKVHKKKDGHDYNSEEKSVEDSDDRNEDVDQNDDEIPQKITTAEDALQLRKANRANVSGHDIPLPIGSFEDLISRFKFSRQLLTNLIDNDFTEPTPIQSEAIPATLYDRDLIACAPTGSGKTLAFLIPMLQQLSSSNKSKKIENKGIRGLIIAPTKELAQQIHTELSKLSTNLNIKPAYLNKSIAAKLRNRSINASKFDILVSTPLRLIELVKDESLDLSYVEQLIFDEADRLFESNFVEQTDRVLSACTNNKLRRSIYSATITSHVEELAQSIMNSPIRIIIGHKEAANSNIHQKLIYCGNEHGKLLAIREMLQNGEFKPPVIIFLQSISRAKALFHELIYDRLNVDVIHAERTPKQRELIIERFKKGELWCLITTDILSRGVDFKGVNLIINYDVPNSAQAYVHRIGRTGRGGKEGRAVTFYTKEDVISIKSVVNVMKQSGSLDGLPKWMQSDDALSKLTKQQKKDLKRRQIERKGISTVPSVVRNKRKLQKEMIVASKKRKNIGKKDETIIPNE